MHKTMVAMAALLSALSGCITWDASHYVIVDVSPGVATILSNVAGTTHDRPSDYIRAGIHYWDAVGCHFIMPDEAPNAVGPHIEIVESADTETATEGEVVAFYDSADGKVKLHRSVVETELAFPEYWTSLWAHEFGHALGLGHINVGHAIMNPVEIDSRLQPLDIEAYEHLK